MGGNILAEGSSNLLFGQPSHHCRFSGETLIFLFGGTFFSQTLSPGGWVELILSFLPSEGQGAHTWPGPSIFLVTWPKLAQWHSIPARELLGRRHLYLPESKLVEYGPGAADDHAVTSWEKPVCIQSQPRRKQSQETRGSPETVSFESLESAMLEFKSTLNLSITWVNNTSLLYFD